MMPNETALKVIKQADLGIGYDDKVYIENCNFLASYNWTHAREPTILVPGAPALWAPPELPAIIPKDDGKARIEENTNRIVAPPFAPLFAALLIMQPSYSLSKISLVSDRNSLRKLLDFAAKRSYTDWRMEAELVNETLFLSRWEKDKVQYFTGSLNSGYGHAFEKAFLKFGEGLEESQAHIRIVEYDIAGMRWTVSSEADGYLGQDSSKEPLKGSVDYQSESKLLATIKNLSLETESLPQTTSPTGVTLLHKGYLVPEASIIEAKCNRIGKEDRNMADKTAQCWFSQTKTMLVGQHRDGSVEKFYPVEMEPNFVNWEAEHQGDLRSLVNLVKDIKEVVRQAKMRKCSLVRDYKERPKDLRVFVSNSEGILLSEEVKERYWGDRVTGPTT